MADEPKPTRALPEFGDISEDMIKEIMTRFSSIIAKQTRIAQIREEAKWDAFLMLLKPDQIETIKKKYPGAFECGDIITPELMQQVALCEATIRAGAIEKEVAALSGSSLAPETRARIEESKRRVFTRR